MQDLSLALPDRAATQRFGAWLAARLRGGDVVVLRGDLGAGKTSLVQGIAQGLGVAHDVTSPTFALMQIHATADTACDLVHADLYRLGSAEDIEAIGLLDCLGADDAVCCIEWPDVLGDRLRGLPVFEVGLRVEGAGRTATLHAPRPLPAPP